jgi:RNA polymerase sigma-70 factor (ECF subfamily)
MQHGTTSALANIPPNLLTDIAKGDTHAFEVLYDESSRILFTLAYRILANHDIASELLEHLYSEIWRKEVRYDPRRGSPLAWLVTLTRTRAVERLQRDPTRLPGSMRRASTSAFLPEDGPACQSFVESELRRAIVQAIAALPVQVQHALDLAYYEGLSASQISTVLNDSAGSVMIALRAGMTQLKHAFSALTLER